MGISLSRNRFSRFSEKVEWWGTASLRSSRQNHLYARWSLTSSHSFDLPPILWTPDYAAWRSACSGVI
jgi:hypothetical protein